MATIVRWIMSPLWPMGMGGARGRATSGIAGVKLVGFSLCRHEEMVPLRGPHRQPWISPSPRNSSLERGVLISRAAQSCAQTASTRTTRAHRTGDSGLSRLGGRPSVDLPGP